jgi:hypothetical protein
MEMAEMNNGKYERLLSEGLPMSLLGLHNQLHRAESFLKT